jgi:Cft2 family RNA processing exonuclease
LPRTTSRSRKRARTRSASNRNIDHGVGARLIAVSGLGAKEPAAFLVETERARLLLDCGEGPDADRLPDLDAIGRVDAVILSHGHKDHVGALRFHERIGRPQVYATAPVIARLQSDVAPRAIPVRGRSEVAGVAIETGMAGHAPGGVWLRLAVGAGLLYMGDNSFESPLYRVDAPPPTTTMIVDASYGDAEETLAVQQVALARQLSSGPALLPVPGDGRGPEIACFLQSAGFDVAIDHAIRGVATMLTQDARACVKEESVPVLQRLIREARPLDANSSPRGVMLAHGPTADVGVAGDLARRWQNEPAPMIVLTGHAASGSSARRLLDSGRALFQRWNVHPTFADNLRLIDTVDPARLVPAFGDAKFRPRWRQRIAPRELAGATPIPL